MVKPEDVSEDQMVLLARDIAKKIEEELTYPGQIKVHVLRETKAVEYSKIREKKQSMLCFFTAKNIKNRTKRCGLCCKLCLRRVTKELVKLFKLIMSAVILIPKNIANDSVDKSNRVHKLSSFLIVFLTISAVMLS